MRRLAPLSALRSLAAAAALAALLSLSGCSEASGKTAPCPKDKFNQVLFAVDKTGTVTTIPADDLEKYQRMGYRPASQDQAKTLALRECPGGFR